MPVLADAVHFGQSMCANWQIGIGLKTTDQQLLLQQEFAALTATQVAQWDQITNADLCPGTNPAA